MKIIVEPAVMARLLSYAVATKNEYSGFGFCERREDGNIHVYDFVLLNIGSWAYTEIEPRTMLPLLQREDRKKMKVWLHRHPLGNGIPGPHNWSSTDEHTIRFEPLGATPQAVNWSVSIVLTPAGFVGRIDNYLKGITEHLEVEPSTKDFFEEVAALSSRGSVPPSEEQPYTKKRQRKSKGSQVEEFPAPETRKSLRIAGRKKNWKNTTMALTIPGRWTLTMKWKQPDTRGFAPRSPSYVESTTQLKPPSPTSARPTELIGTRNEKGATDPVDTGNNLS